MIVRGQSPAASVEAVEEPVAATTAAFRTLPVPSLKPAAKVATHLRTSWRHTAAAFSRVKDFSGEFLDRTPSANYETPQPVELTPVPAAEEELQPLELIPIDGSQSSRSTPSAHRRFVAVGVRRTDPENPFARPADGLSRLSTQPTSNISPSTRDVSETRLHRQAESAREDTRLKDWSRFPTRIR